MTTPPPSPLSTHTHAVVASAVRMTDGSQVTGTELTRPHRPSSFTVQAQVEFHEYYPQNRKYITYRIAVGGRSSHGHRYTENLVKSGRVVLRNMRAERQIDRHGHADRNSS